VREAELLTLQHGAFGIRQYIFIGAKHDAAAHFTVPGDVPAATASTVAISMGQQKNGTADVRAVGTARKLQVQPRSSRAPYGGVSHRLRFLPLRRTLVIFEHWGHQVWQRRGCRPSTALNTSAQRRARVGRPSVGACHEKLRILGHKANFQTSKAAVPQ
jgi:hypothetical protein